jgi:hypothetical protein
MTLSSSWPATAIAVAFVAFFVSVPALAQSGSLGGTVGKTNKSVSGDLQSKANRHAPSPNIETRRCEKAAGNWTFSNGVDVAIKPDGSATSNGFSASWTCHGGQITMRWPAFTDHYSILADGNTLSGISGLGGASLSATRKN